MSGPVRGEEGPLEVNSDDLQNRRILRRGDPPQNLQDAAALRLLYIVERVPRLEIIRLTVFTVDPKGRRHHRAPTKPARGIMLLELKSVDHPVGECGGLLYLRVELALAEVFTMSLEELVARLCDELSAREDLISALALKGGPPCPEVVLAN
jgi:hypothetical protein